MHTPRAHWDKLLDTVKKEAQMFGNVVRTKETAANMVLQGKVEREKITRKTSKTVTGLCKGKDRAEFE